jgi:hypothetical protein
LANAPEAAGAVPSAVLSKLVCMMNGLEKCLASSFQR